MMARGAQTACCLHGLSSAGENSHMTLLGHNINLSATGTLSLTLQSAAEHCCTAAHGLLSVSALRAAKLFSTAVRLSMAHSQCP